MTFCHQYSIAMHPTLYCLRSMQAAVLTADEMSAVTAAAARMAVAPPSLDAKDYVEWTSWPLFFSGKVRMNL